MKIANCPSEFGGVLDNEEACSRLERGVETPEDLLELLGPVTSLGGARPKAAVKHGAKLLLAKFQSNLDTERTACWEATMLDLAQQAGIQTAKHRILNKHDARPVLLVERFDRVELARIPFASAMTLAGLRDGQEFSYAELASVLNGVSSHIKHDHVELWRRMTFNAMAGNTDDHMRNHAFLRGEQGWRLSPAFDLNPNSESIERRIHSLAFYPSSHYPQQTPYLPS